MVIHLDTLSSLHANKSFLLLLDAECLMEKQVPIFFFTCDWSYSTIYLTWGQNTTHYNDYTTEELSSIVKDYAE
jgi:hypothetical protein